MTHSGCMRISNNVALNADSEQKLCLQVEICILTEWDGNIGHSVRSYFCLTKIYQQQFIHELANDQFWSSKFVPSFSC